MIINFWENLRLVKNRWPCSTASDLAYSQSERNKAEHEPDNQHTAPLQKRPGSVVSAVFIPGKSDICRLEVSI